MPPPKTPMRGGKNSRRSGAMTTKKPSRKAETTPPPPTVRKARGRLARGSTPRPSSSEKEETPTIVGGFTEASPFPGDSGGRTLATAASSRDGGGKAMLFREEEIPHSQGSSPGSKAGQTADDESTASRSSDDDGSQTEDSDEDRVICMIQNVLEGGIASICRLRGLFPSDFFQKHDFVDGTTITKFNEEEIKRICRQAAGLEENEADDDEEEEASVVKSIRTRTQKTLSPLTQKTLTQKPRKRTEDAVVYSDQEKRTAMEALMLLRWTKRDGIDVLLREGNLANVVFGICVPSEGKKSATSDDEMIESYSFDISFSKPDESGGGDGDEGDDEVCESVGKFFQNLNGFRAGRSLSQMVPSKTQCTHPTQASYYSQTQTQASVYTQTQTQMTSVDYSLSQKHHPSDQSQSQMALTQLSQQLSHTSQSILRKVKKNRGRHIPENRYLTLRVGLNKTMRHAELPSALKKDGRASAAARLETSPVPVVGTDKRSAANGAMRVTPLGSIRGARGLSVDVEARSKVVDNEARDVDEKSVSFDPLFTQPPENEEDEDALSVADKENVPAGVQVGGRGFAIPVDGGMTFLLAEIKKDRVVTSAFDGTDKEELKCSFFSDKLSKKKQWILRRNVISCDAMTRKVEGALKGADGSRITPRFIQNIAQQLMVDPTFVQEIAKKRKAPIGKATAGRTKSKRSKSVRA